jgi:ABC-type dipeptide/oligopeptide/nickel transport system permease component
VVVFAAFAVLSLNLMIDILYAAIDPRIRLT